MLALNPSIANTQYGLSLWMSDDGLPQNWVGAIAQTPDGYLWFATEEGLARFDGVRFTTFFDRKSIYALLVSHDGSLWISVNGGLARYKDHLMTNYTTRDGLRQARISSMSEGSDGSIWMATRSGLNRFYQGKFSAYTVTDGSATTWILSTCVTRDGALWWGTNGGGLKRLYQGRDDLYDQRRAGRQHRLRHPTGPQGRSLDRHERRPEQDARREDQDLPRAPMVCQTAP